MSRHSWYVFFSRIILILIIPSGVAILVGILSPLPVSLMWFRVAFFSFLLSAACIEIRVRMGYRLPRTRLFWIHLAVAVPFLVLLGFCAFVPLPYLVQLLIALLYIGTLLTGLKLFVRGFTRSMKVEPRA